ncbi:MAG: CD225/dispanin family protein [Elusimicrobiota bacterium]
MKKCPKCGMQNSDRALECQGCSTVLKQADKRDRRGYALRTYLVHSIIVTLCFCLPLGIVGIVNAARAQAKLEAGDYTGASYYSDKAKKWAGIGFLIGLLPVLYYIMIMLAGLISGF